MEKPIKVKPGLYSLFYEHLKQIAYEYGYNLVIHGSLNRDLDLIAIPWIDEPRDEQEMVKDMQMWLTGMYYLDGKGNVPFTVLPGNRHSYVIELNRGNKKGEWLRFADEQYYIDLSITQITKK